MITMCGDYRQTICKKKKCCFECEKRGECWEFNGVCNGLTKGNYKRFEYNKRDE